MLKNVTFGQYYPAKSVVHKADGRTKLILTVLFLILIFVADNAASLIVIALFLAAVMRLSNVPFLTYLKNVKPILPIIILTSLLNALYVSGGKHLLHFWLIDIYSDGIITAVYMSSRIVMLVLCSAVMTYTTAPTDLTDSIEKLLSPLEFFKIDIHSIALMMSITLRFIPTLIEETDKIISAQKSRGADLESGNIFNRVKALVPILVPLLISSFRRAYELTDAMECRCYHGGKGKTRLKQMKMTVIDIIAFLLFVLLFAVVIIFNKYFDGAVSFAFMSTINYIKGII